MPFTDAPDALRSPLASPSLSFSFLFRLCDFYLLVFPFLYSFLFAPFLQSLLPLPFHLFSLFTFPNSFSSFSLCFYARPRGRVPPNPPKLPPPQQAPSVSVVTLIMSKWRRVGLFVNWSDEEENKMSLNFHLSLVTDRMP